MSLLQLSALEFEKFLLIALRVGGIMTVAPIFGHRNVPAMVKIGIILTLSIILLPVVAPLAGNTSPELFSLAGMLTKEVAAGLLIGFTSLLVFIAVQFAGNIVGIQMGFGIVNVIDANSSAQVPIIGQLQFLLAMLIFLSLNGHHLIISTVAYSFQIIPLGQITFSNVTGEILTRAAVNVMVLAIKLGAPCIVTLFLLDVSLGIVARTVPSMNIFIVGFPLKIGVGLFMLAMSFPIFGYVFAKFLQDLDSTLNRLLYSLKPV